MLFFTFHLKPVLLQKYYFLRGGSKNIRRKQKIPIEQAEISSLVLCD